MDYLTKIYKEKCKKEFSALGFKTYGRNFYRVVNDMFQSFQLHKSVSGGQCTIEFVATPLCTGDWIKKTSCGSDHLKMFEDDYSWFYYDRYNECSVNACVDEMIGYMKKYLIPFFESCDNSKNAYFATCDFQKKNYRIGIFMADSSLFDMALKAKLYDKALIHLIARREHTENAYRVNTQNWEKRGVETDPEYEERIQTEIKDLSYQIKMLSEQNVEYFKKYIEKNESEALLNLGIKK